MTSSQGDRSLPPPACHAAIHEFGISFQAHIRAQPQFLHNSGPETLLEDNDLARELGRKGRDRAKEFAWDKTARAVLDQLKG